MNGANHSELEIEFGRRAIEVNDLVLAEEFYGGVLVEILGGHIDSRYMLTTEELLEAQRRVPKGLDLPDGAFLYSRPPYTKVTVGPASILLHVAPRHIQEPPPEQTRGAPRVAFTATLEQIDRAVAVLTTHHVLFEGPVHHPPPSPIAQSLYFKDPSGNFLELACPRDPPYGRGRRMEVEMTSISPFISNTATSLRLSNDELSRQSADAATTVDLGQKRHTASAISPLFALKRGQFP